MIFASLALLLISCSKESDDDSGTYISQVFEIGKIRLFTKSGEITDPIKIKNFINARDFAGGHFITNPDSVINVQNLYKLVMLPTNEAKFITFRDSVSYNVINRNNIVYLESKDTTTQLIIDDSDINMSKMFKYSPIYSEEASFFTSWPYPGYYFATKIKRCIYFIPLHDAIIYPLLNYLYFRAYEDGVSWKAMASQNINNVFNRDSIQILGKTDTIAVQENKLKLVKTALEY